MAYPSSLHRIFTNNSRDRTMIPKQMEEFLRKQLPERTWKNRLFKENDLCYMEFNPLDVDRLSKLGIEVDSLGPKMVACIWDEGTNLEVGGYLVVDNLAMGRPSMGGIRMLPDLNPHIIHNLARGMTLKNAAAILPYGGGKGGIVAKADLSPEEHTETIRRFARLIYRYRDIYLPGPDVGTNDKDMGTIAIENGLDNALSKPEEMGGNRIDELGAAGGGLAIAIDALLHEMPRLNETTHDTTQFSSDLDDLTVIIQGFGAVGAHAARLLCQQIPNAKIIGISDISGYLYNEDGLPINELFELWKARGTAARAYFDAKLSKSEGRTKFSNYANDLLRESATCMIPAAPVAHYLDTEASTNPSMTTEKIGKWKMIVEGANTYSPDPTERTARARMEREVYRQRGTLIATDYLVNSGGVIFAAQEHLIKTPSELRIPDEYLGNQKKVDQWLEDHKDEFNQLAADRLKAAERARNEVIRRNMHELIDILSSDADMLPSEAAEKISIRRITVREQDRKAKDVMESIVTIHVDCPVQEAARLLVETGCPILAVVDGSMELAGVLTNWDITRAAASGSIENESLENVMTSKVVYASPGELILDIVRKLEHYEISAMPVVENHKVLGMISTDLLSRRTLYQLLQAPSD
jgi:glutamate dehydrogenase (NAD(P)+)